MSTIVTEEFIDVTEFTRNVTTVKENNFNEVIGDGVFDVIMKTVTQHLDAQFDNGRIKGEAYSGAYIELMKTVLDTSTRLILQKAIADKQQELVDAQIATEQAKGDLYKRQTKGFDDDAKQKILKILVDVWGLAFSVAKDNPDLIVPEGINRKTIDSLIKDILVDSELGQDGTGPIDLKASPFEGLFK